MNIDPQHWQPPEWHPDWGDPIIEMEHLRAFAMKLLNACPEVIISLEISEPGLMRLKVDLPNGKPAEVYSNPSLINPESRHLAVFMNVDTENEDEMYVESIEEAVSLFTVT